MNFWHGTEGGSPERAFTATPGRAWGSLTSDLRHYNEAVHSAFACRTHVALVKSRMVEVAPGCGEGGDCCPSSPYRGAE